jgi:hypothetical protein
MLPNTLPETGCSVDAGLKLRFETKLLNGHPENYQKCRRYSGDGIFETKQEYFKPARRIS